MTVEHDDATPAGARTRWSALRGAGLPRAYPLVQFPNAPLWIAIAAWILERLLEGAAQAYASAVGFAGIVVWAWLELTDGVNLFRRVLGAVVLVNAIVGLGGRLG